MTDPSPRLELLDLDVWRNVELAAREVPREVALVDRHREVTYAALADEVRSAAGSLLVAGVRPGARVAACASNVADLAVVYFASMALGAVWTGVNRSLSPAERVTTLQRFGPDLVVLEDGIEEPGQGWPVLRIRLGEWSGGPPRRSPELGADARALAVIAFSSGTTGQPKGVQHSQRNLLVAAMANHLAGPDRLGLPLPATIPNVMTLGPLQSLLLRGTCVLMDRIDVEGVVDWVERASIERMAVPPPLAYDLALHDAADPARLKALTKLSVGAGPAPEVLRRAFFDRHGWSYSTNYGLSEVPTAVTREPWGAPVAGSSGRALPHVVIRIRDDGDADLARGAEGEICVVGADRGPWAGIYRPMLGYLDDPVATSAALRNGVLHTGDIGYLDDDGYLFVTGRRSDVIIRGGANIHPAEIEARLAEHPAVAAVVVTGLAHPRLGEEVVAVIVPNGSASIDLDELAAWCGERLSRAKVPSRFLLVDDLPRNAMRKVVRPSIRALVVEAFPSNKNQL